MCLDPILEYGAEALRSAASGQMSRAFEETVLAIIVTTGIASILLTKDHVIDYNTGLAHAIFYTLTSYPQIESSHLHGEVVSLGVLLLLLVDGQQEMFERIYRFSRSVKLPVCLSDVDIPDSEQDHIIDRTLEAKDLKHYPYVVTRPMLEDAFRSLNALL